MSDTPVIIKFMKKHCQPFSYILNKEEWTLINVIDRFLENF